VLEVWEVVQIAIERSINSRAFASEGFSKFSPCPNITAQIFEARKEYIEYQLTYPKSKSIRLTIPASQGRKRSERGRPRRLSPRGGTLWFRLPVLIIPVDNVRT
jgi:hypothetical protein